MFTIAQTAALAGIDITVARQWFSKHGHFPLADADQDALPGGTRRLSQKTVIAVCVAAALTRLGVPISRAAVAGLAFAHTDTAETSKRRPLGGLYPGNTLTLIVILADGGYRIIEAKFGMNPMALLTAIGEDGATLLPVNPIVGRIEALMGKA